MLHNLVINVKNYTELLSLNWVLFVDVFQKISDTVGRYMACADYALHTEDTLTIEEKYHLRFGYFIYCRHYCYSVEDDYEFHKILPWFAVPDWSIRLQRRERTVSVNILDL